jgi:hypothetical protein
MIDPDGHSAEIWRPEDDLPVIEHQALLWHPTGTAEPFTLELAELFRAI